MAEQSVVFNNNFRKNPEEFQSFLVFNLMNDDGETFDQEVAVSCGEDIEDYMKSFFKKQWKDLLPEYMEDVRIVDGTLEGIHLKGKKEEGRFSTYMLNGYTRSTFIVNEKVLQDANKEKLLKIGKIVLG